MFRWRDCVLDDAVTPAELQREIDRHQVPEPSVEEQELSNLAPRSSPRPVPARGNRFSALEQEETDTPDDDEPWGLPPAPAEESAEPQFPEASKSQKKRKPRKKVEKVLIDPEAVIVASESPSEGSDTEPEPPKGKVIPTKSDRKASAPKVSSVVIDDDGLHKLRSVLGVKKSDPIPKWALRAYAVDPTKSLRQIASKSLTAESFTKWFAPYQSKTDSKETAASLNKKWSNVKSKFRGVRLLKSPVSSREKSFRKEYDLFKKAHPDFRLPKLHEAPKKDFKKKPSPKNVKEKRTRPPTDVSMTPTASALAPFIEVLKLLRPLFRD